MKHHLNSISKFAICQRLLLAFLFLFLVYSCRKDLVTTKQQESDENTIMLAKQWYNKAYPLSVKLKSKLNIQNVDTSKWTDVLSPYWDKGVVFESKKMDFIEFPALKSGDVSFSTKSVNPNLFNYKKSSSISSILIIKRQGVYSAYTMTILADSAYLKGDYGKITNNTYSHREKDFTGLVLYHSLNGSFVNGWQYIDGVVTNAVYEKQVSSTGGNKGVQIVNGLKLNKQVCDAVQITTYWEDCAYYTNDLTYSNPFDCKYYQTTKIYTSCADDGTGGGNGSESTPPICPPANTPPGGEPVEVSAKGIPKKVRVYQPPVTPIDPSGGINPPGNPADQPCLIPQPVPTDTVKLKDPCVQKGQIKANAQNANLATENTAVYNTLLSVDGKEYGAEQNLTSLPANLKSPLMGGNYMNIPVRGSTTSSSSDRFEPNFTWDATHGYTIGATHSHPGGSAPSPIDVIFLVTTSNNGALRLAGQSAVDFYKANASVTAVTEDFNYVLTVNDWNGLSAQVNSMSVDQIISQFNSLARESGGSTEYALISMFGDKISLFRAGHGSNEYIPLSIDKTTNTIVLVDCPTN